MFDDLRELYQEVILDHSKNPRNFRHPEDANREAKGENPLCGDRLIVYLRVGDGGLIEDAAFLGNGCAISKASASMMTEMLKGRTEAEAAALFRSFHHLCTHDDPPPDDARVSGEDLERLHVLSGVRQFPVRVKCATLAWHAMDAAMAGGGAASTE